MFKLNEEHSKMIEVIKNTILNENNKTFLIVSHVGPDGDNVGSTIAMMLLLKKLGKEVMIYNQDTIPYVYNFLKGTDEYKSSIDENMFFDVVIVVDNSDENRIGKHWKGKKLTNTIIQIDHHLSATVFGDIVYIDEKASAVGEMLYFVILAFGENIIDEDIANALYVSILTDTGSFRYSNTSSKTFYVASKLIEHGSSPSKINLEVYENVAYDKIKLLQEVLATLELNEDKNFAIMYLKQDVYKKYQTNGDITEGFVNYGRIIKGVEVSCMLKEVAKNKYKVSLRSKKFNVAQVAIDMFGGGGHENASGGSIEGELFKLVNNFKTLFTKLLKEK